MLIIVASAMPALANLDCRDTSSYCPEGASQRYWRDASVTGGWATSCDQDISHDLTPTDLITQIVSSHSNSDVAEFLVSTPLPNSFLGVTSCADPSGGVCFALAHHCHDLRLPR